MPPPCVVVAQSGTLTTSVPSASLVSAPRPDAGSAVGLARDGAGDAAGALAAGAPGVDTHDASATARIASRFTSIGRRGRLLQRAGLRERRSEEHTSELH